MGFIISTKGILRGVHLYFYICRLTVVSDIQENYGEIGQNMIHLYDIQDDE